MTETTRPSAGSIDMQLAVSGRSIFCLNISWVRSNSNASTSVLDCVKPDLLSNKNSAPESHCVGATFDGPGFVASPTRTPLNTQNGSHGSGLNLFELRDKLSPLAIMFHHSRSLLCIETHWFVVESSPLLQRHIWRQHAQIPRWNGQRPCSLLILFPLQL